jgi:hypothetical protein
VQVTAIQPVGAKGLGSVQATVVDDRSASSAGSDSSSRAAASRSAVPDTPQPVVFLGGELGRDARTDEMRLRRAVERYDSDGGGKRRQRRRD